MNDIILFYVTTFTSLYAITNPIGVAPIFISLTQGMERKERLHEINKTSLTVLIVLCGSVFAGEFFLRFFGISVAAFRVAGGMLLLMMALSMLQARQGPTKRTPEEMQEAQLKDDIAVVPLAIPLLSGPGAISSVILYSNRSEGVVDKLLLFFICFLVAVAVFFTLRLAEPISRRLGQTGINIVTRIMGLIVAAIAIQAMSVGLLGLFPNWG